MQPGSTLASPADVPRDPSSRDRGCYRHLLTSLAYVRLDHANGGIIRNLSESGIAIQAVGRLHPDQVVHLRFELLKPKIRVDTTGQVIWADAFGQAGVRFVDLRPRAQRHVRDWILTDLLAAATEFGPHRAPIFSNSVEAESTDGMVVSAAAIRSIPVLENEPPASSPRVNRHGSDMPLRLSWWPVDIYPQTLARFVDTLVVVSAVLLFGVIAIEMAGTFPSWPIAISMGLVLACAFAAIYRLFFKYLAGATLGTYLARIAADDVRWIQRREEDAPRFR